MDYILILKASASSKYFGGVDQNDNARYYAMWELDQSDTLAIEREKFKKAKNEHCLPTEGREC